VQDSPSSKLLYAKDIPRYRRLISEFYQSVKQLPVVSNKDMSLIMSEHSTVLPNICQFLFTAFVDTSCLLSICCMCCMRDDVLTDAVARRAEILKP